MDGSREQSTQARTGRHRPRLRPPLSRLEVALIVLSVAGVVANIAPVAVWWAALPGTVPTHFAASGRPDAVGGKGQLLAAPIFAVVVTALFMLLARVPHLLNYPVAITLGNAERQYRRGRVVLRVVNAGLVWALAVWTWFVMQAALGHAVGLPSWFTPVAIALALLVPVGALTLIVVWAVRG